MKIALAIYKSGRKEIVKGNELCSKKTVMVLRLLDGCGRKRGIGVSGWGVGFQIRGLMGWAWVFRLGAVDVREIVAAWGCWVERDGG